MSSSSPWLLNVMLTPLFSSVVLVVCLLCVGGCSGERTPLEIESLIDSHLALYPDMQVQDWYKLLHQASMGSRHLGVDDSLIYAYLSGEWDRIEGSNQQPLLEYISPDSSMVRLHLRPYKEAGGTPEAVFDAMKNTWDTFEPSTVRLEEMLNELTQAASRGALNMQKETIIQFITEQKDSGFSAVHHSALYESEYRPAYRVIERQHIPELP